MMKLILSLAAFFAMQSTAQANLNGFYNVTCRYKDNGVVKKSVVTTSVKYYASHYEPTVKLSVSYVRANGKKVVESATVTDAGYTGSYEGYMIDAVTTTGRKMELTMYLMNGPGPAGFYSAFMAVNGHPQNHMKNLRCKFATAG